MNAQFQQIGNYIKDEDVIAIARTMLYEYRFEDMSILGDALEDAGCDNDDILNHCRGIGCEEVVFSQVTINRANRFYDNVDGGWKVTLYGEPLGIFQRRKLAKEWAEEVFKIREWHQFSQHGGFISKEYFKTIIRIPQHTSDCWVLNLILKPISNI